MKLFLDTAEFDEIKHGVDWRVIDGVTTNPTLIAKAGQDHKTQVKKICGIVDSVSAEVESEKKDDILVAGRRLASWPPAHPGSSTRRRRHDHHDRPAGYGSRRPVRLRPG